MTNVVNGKWAGAKKDRWPIGRGVAIYMRPETAERHLDAGVRLGDRMIAVGTAIRRVLHDLFAPLDITKPAKEGRAEPAVEEPAKPRWDKAA